MTSNKKAWRTTMKQKYKVDDAGLSEIMRERQKKSRRKGLKGGLNYLSKEELSELGRKAAKARWSKRDKL